MDVDAVEVALDPVALDDRARRGLLDEHARVHLFEVASGAANDEAAHHGLGRRHRDDVALSRPDEHRARLAFERQPARDADLAAVLAALQHDDVAVGGAVEHGLQVGLVRRHDNAFRRGRQGEAGGDEGRLPETRDGGAKKHRSDALRLDQHAPLHLHVHRVAEPGAVVPIDAGLDRP